MAARITASCHSKGIDSARTQDSQYALVSPNISRDAFMASEIYPMVEIEDYPERFAPEGSDLEVLRAKAVDRIRSRMSTIENAIAGPWLLNTGFSAADIYVSMFSQWTHTKEWREANLPKVLALTAAVAERPKAGAVWKKHYGT